MYAGLAGLTNMMVAYGPGNRIGVVDQWGHFYYFRDLNNEARYSGMIGKTIPEISEEYVSINDPTVAVQGQLPWGLPGAVNYIPPATSGSSHTVPWYHKGKYYLYGAGALAGLALLGSDTFQNAMVTGAGGTQRTTYMNPAMTSQYNAVMNWNPNSPATSWNLNNPNPAFTATSRVPSVFGTDAYYNPTPDINFSTGGNIPTSWKPSFLSGYFDEYDNVNRLSGLGDAAASMVRTTNPSGQFDLKQFWSQHKTAIEITMIAISVLSLWRFLSSKK